jgi:hypothetical protein
VTIAPVSGQSVLGWTGNSYVVAFRDPEGCFLPCNAAIDAAGSGRARK